MNASPSTPGSCSARTATPPVTAVACTPSSGATLRNAAATARKSSVAAPARERGPMSITARGASRRKPMRSARRRRTVSSQQPPSTSAASDAPASQSASMAWRSVPTCSAMSVAARRSVSMSPPTKRDLCSMTTSRPQVSAPTMIGAMT